MAQKLKFNIKTPRGEIVTTTTKDGTIKAEIKWADGFGEKKSSSMSNAQEFVDSEVLRYCAPLVPFLSGVLQQSGILGTTIGSGRVEYVTPYARRQYYENKGAKGQRGSKWFERMKASNLEAIKRGASKIAND